MHYTQYKGYFCNSFCDQDSKLPLRIISQTDQTSFLHNFQHYSHHIYIKFDSDDLTHHPRSIGTNEMTVGNIQAAEIMARADLTRN